MDAQQNPAPWHLPSQSWAFSKWLYFTVGLISWRKQEIKAEPFLPSEHVDVPRPPGLQVCFSLPSLCHASIEVFLCPGHTFCFASVLLRCFSSSIAPNKAAGFLFFLYLNFLFFSPAAFQRPVCKLVLLRTPPNGAVTVGPSLKTDEWTEMEQNSGFFAPINSREVSLE